MNIKTIWHWKAIAGFIIGLLVVAIGVGILAISLALHPILGFLVGAGVGYLYTTIYVQHIPCWHFE